MKNNTAKAASKAYATIGVVAVAMLLSSAFVVPSSNAYAISQNGNNGSGDRGFFNLFFSLFGNFLGNQPTTTQGTGSDNQGDLQGSGDANGKAVGGGDEKNEQSDRKGLHDPSNIPPGCKNPVAAKYNKNCQA